MDERPGYLLVVPWPVTDRGGVNQVVLNLYRQVEAAGEYTPGIWVTSWQHRRLLTTREEGRSVAYLRLRRPIGRRRRLGATAGWLATAAVFLVPELLRIARFLRANDVTCVNIHYPSLAALQLVLARLLFARRLRIILTFHGLDLAHAARTTGIERRMWRALLRRADAVVSCSRAQAELVATFEPSVRSRMATIHNGVDIARLMEDRNVAARVDARLAGRRFILSVASLEPKKGIDTLLHAFAILRAENTVDAMLALVGPDVGVGERLRGLAAELGVSDHVVFCGELPHRDLHAYYTGAAVFCLASRAEPFGIVLLEAGAFRCPVVATAVGGIPEILEHDVTARLAPPDDPPALAAQLRRTLCDTGDAKRLADALHRRVEADFSWRNAHRAYMRLVARLEASIDAPGHLGAPAQSRTTTLRD